MWHLKYKFNQEDGGDSSPGGGGSTSTQSSQSGQQQSNQTSQQQSRDKNNKDGILNPWVIADKLDSESGDRAAANARESRPAPASSQNVTEQMSQFIKGLRLTDGIDTAQIAADLRNDEIGSFNAALETIAANTFQQTMIQSNKLMDTRIKSAVNEAVQKATGSVSNSLAMRELHNKLEFTKDPAVEPVAQAVMQAFLKKNPDTDEAIRGTEQFFEQVSRTAAEHFKMIPPKGDLGNQPFGGANIRSSQANEKVPDWLEVLTGTTPDDEE